MTADDERRAALQVALAELGTVACRLHELDAEQRYLQSRMPELVQKVKELQEAKP